MDQETRNYLNLHTHDGANSQFVFEKSISFSDITNNDASTTKHGYLPKLSGSATQVLLGSGVFGSVPLTSVSGVLPVANGGTGATTILGANIPLIVGKDRKTAQTSNASLATYTVGASDGSFTVSANINVTTSTSHNITVTCTYTDETNTSRTLTLGFTQLAGAVLLSNITNITGAGPYEGIPYHIRAKAGTPILLATIGTFTTITYNFEEIITQYA